MGLFGDIFEKGGQITGFMLGGPLGINPGGKLGKKVGAYADDLAGFEDPKPVGDFAFNSPFSTPGENSPYTNEGGQDALANFERYSKDVGHTSGMDENGIVRSHAAAYHILGAVGLSNTPKADSSQVGVDGEGRPVFSSNAFRNNTNTKIGNDAIIQTGTLFGSVGAFKDAAEAQAFAAIGANAADPGYLQELDNLRTSQDPKGFVNALGKGVGTPLDRDSTGYAGYKLFENWNLLSPSQKSAAVAGIGVQGYKFSDGHTIASKEVTPRIPGTPPMKLGEVSALAAEGLNVAGAVNKWEQLAAIQDTFYETDSAGTLTKQMASMGVLGHGPGGQAVPVSKEVLGQIGAVPLPHYGVGALGVPRGSGVPTGYVKTASIDGSDVIIPQANATSSFVRNPVVATKNAQEIYSKWSDQGKRIDRGVVGGSALAGSLHAMADMNPYSLGAVMVQDAYKHQKATQNAPKDLTTVARLMGVNFHRLRDGSASAESDSKAEEFVADHDFNKQNFQALRKAVRGGYARNGISSKEAAYQLANQAYAEGRLNDIQLVSAQKTMDMLYDDNGYIVAQKLLTGKNKGFEIASKRRG